MAGKPIFLVALLLVVAALLSTRWYFNGKQHKNNGGPMTLPNPKPVLRLVLKPKQAKDAPTEAKVKEEKCPKNIQVPSWSPEPKGDCKAFDDKTRQCGKKCGNCFNAGARAGVMCKGHSPGYNCPAEAQGSEGGIAFACMDWTFGSTAMRAAEDSYNCRSGKDPVNFGVGTYGTSKEKLNGLGACVRMQVEGLHRDIIAQSINTGTDVAGNQFDLQVAAGGVGSFNTCAGSDDSMYSGDIDVWGKRYGGLAHYKQCDDLPEYPRDSEAMKAAGDNLVELCKYSFKKGVRREMGINPTIISIVRVACPAELVNLTQIRRTDEPDESEPEEHIKARKLLASHTCDPDGTATGSAWCLTRMMDCRKPSGGFKDNVDEKLMAAGHRLVQPCTADGYTRIDVQCGCHDCYC